MLLTPFLGVTFGGDTPSQQANYGVSLAFLAGNVLGVEFDATLTPNFFDSESNALADGHMSTVMANVMLAAPMQGARIRPYVSAGAGLLRAKATGGRDTVELAQSRLGVDIGAGAMGFMQDTVGVRGDLRYFRALQDSNAAEDVDLGFGALAFWRATLDVSFRF